MGCVDRYGLRLTGGVDAVAAYNRGVGDLLRLEEGSLARRRRRRSPSTRPSPSATPPWPCSATSCARPSTSRPGSATPGCTPGAAPSASAATCDAVARHVAGDSAPLVRTCAGTRRTRCCSRSAVPTIAFAGVTTVPQDAWDIVERCAPAYGDDWWFAGLLAFMRQEQGRFDEAMELSCLSLDTEPGAGHSAHARAHAHYETGDHTGGLAWMDGWITGAGAAGRQPVATSPGTRPCTSCRWATWTPCGCGTSRSCAPRPGMGCRSLVDSGSLLVALDADPRAAARCRASSEVLAVVDATLLHSPPSRVHGDARRRRAVRRGGRRGAGDAGPVLRLAHADRDARRGRRSPGARAAPAGARRPVRRPPTRSARCGAAAVAGRRQRRPARGGRGDPDLRAWSGPAGYAEALAAHRPPLDRRRCRRDEWFRRRLS